MNKVLVILALLTVAACSSSPDTATQSQPQYGMMMTQSYPQQVQAQVTCFQYSVPFEGKTINGQVCDR